MILCNRGEEYRFGNVVFTVGDRVCGLEGSVYINLIGKVKEIHIYDDAETQKSKVDIYVDFMLPVLQKDRQEMVNRFSTLLGKPVAIEDINLTSVVMHPQEIIPTLEEKSNLVEVPVFLLREEWADGDECGSFVWVFSNRADAERKMRDQLTEESIYGLLAKWQGSGDLLIDEREDFYEWWLDCNYYEAHYNIGLSTQSIYLSSDTASDICNIQIAANRAEDFLEEISQWEETEDLTEEQLAEMVQFTDVPNRIKEKLATNSTYWSAYYKSLSEASCEAVKAYLAHIQPPDEG